MRSIAALAVLAMMGVEAPMLVVPEPAVEPPAPLRLPRRTDDDRDPPPPLPPRMLRGLNTARECARRRRQDAAQRAKRERRVLALLRHLPTVIPVAPGTAMSQLAARTVPA